MSRVRYSLPILFLILALTVSAAPVKNPDPLPSSKTTVGEFALRVIKLSSDNPSRYSSLTAEEAVKMLKQAGLNLKGSVNDPLTKESKSDFAFAVANGLLEKLNTPPPGFEACLALTSVPECHACCLSLPGADHQACGQSCGRNHADQQHASASEPTP